MAATSRRNWIIFLYISTTLSYSVLAAPQGSYNHNLHQQPQNNHNNNHNYNPQFNHNGNHFQNQNYQQGAQNNYNNNNNQLPVSALHSGNSNSLSQSQYPVPPPPPGQVNQQQQQQSQKLLQQSIQQTQAQKLQQAYLQNKQNQFYQQQYQNTLNRNQIPITSFNNDLSHDGSFAYGYTTGDGQLAQAQGFVKNLGNKDLEAQVVQGAYSYTSPDGTPISVKYQADENGFRPEGLHLPTPPPIPKEILRALEYIARVQATNPQLYQQNQQFSGNYNQVG